MNTFVDASVVVAALVEDDDGHAAAVDWLAAEARARTRLFVSDHTLAEVYAKLSVGRFAGRMLKANQVQRVFNGFLERVEVIETDAGDYRKAVDACVKRDHRGKVVYDAVHARAARKRRIKRLATFNGDDFRRVWDQKLEVLRIPTDESADE